MGYTAKDVLNIQVAPALGCTEPAAIALGAAAAASLLPKGAEVDSIEVWVDPNVYKNGLAVAIPGAEGMHGLDLAAALGALGGDPSLMLEVLEPIDEKCVSEARRFAGEGKVKVDILADRHGLYVKSLVKAGGHEALSVIEKLHDNLVTLALDNGEIAEHPLLARRREQGGDAAGDLEEWLRGLNLDQLMELTDELDGDDLAFLQEGLDVNLRLAEYGLKHGPGLGIGKALERLVRQNLIKRDMVLAARMTASAAADARMSGAKLPAMSSAGSGNHGLTAVLPIAAVSEYIDCTREQKLRAIALSHFVTAYVKAHTGRLSAVCGCSIAAGAGAAAGTTYLLGGTAAQIAAAVTNLIEDLAGVICDGAKTACSLKLATAAGTAVQAALLAVQGICVRPTDGIAGDSLEQTTKNIGELSREGMVETDRTILHIMLNKRFSDYASQI